MNRLESIKERLEHVSTKRGMELYDAREIFSAHAEADIDYLIERLEIYETGLLKYSDMIVTDSEDRPHDVGHVAREALEKVYFLLDTIEQLREERDKWKDATRNEFVERYAEGNQLRKRLERYEEALQGIVQKQGNIRPDGEAWEYVGEFKESIKLAKEALED